MGRQGLEVADVVRTHRDDLVGSRGACLTKAERRAFDDITACRTAALGGHVERCDRCSHLDISYNSCRNRHCPKCQASAGREWLADRQVDLLPVEYFHIVFTVPYEIAAIAQQNKKIVYDILFRASSETLREVASDPKHLGAEVGFFSVLHTWGQNLHHHPHVHCVVPGGGPSTDGSRWVSAPKGFFLPVKVLSRVFRGKFLAFLTQAFERGDLGFHGQLARLEAVKAFRHYLRPLYELDWFVYAKPPFGGPAQVLRYLARYTHRVAISNSRLLSLNNGKVSFLCKDYARACRKKVVTLTAVEFLRRFLLHLLPKGFQRIRHYGFLANRCRREKLHVCRELLLAKTEGPSAEAPSVAMEADPVPPPCPKCGKGRMLRVLSFDRGKPVPDLSDFEWNDTS